MNSWGRRRQRRPARSWSMGPILARRRLGAGVDVIRWLSDSAGDSLFDHCGRDRAVVQARLARVRTQPIFEHALGAGGWTAVLAELGSAYHEVMGDNSGLSHDEQHSTALTVEEFRTNLAAVDDRITAAAARAGRDRPEIESPPVSKTVPQ